MMQSTQYVAGKMPGRLMLAPHPWYVPMPAPVVRIKRPKAVDGESKYGFHLLSVGESTVVPYGNVSRKSMYARVSILLIRRRATFPERYMVNVTPTGIRIERTA